MKTKTRYLMANVKDFPDAFTFNNYLDEDTYIDQPGFDPMVKRNNPAIYVKDEDEDSIYYTRNNKDCFFFQKTDFGWMGTCLECDKKNLDRPEDFGRAVYSMCEKVIPVEKILSTH